MIHSEDNDIVMHMYAKLIREGRTGFENMAEVHNTLSEDLSFSRVIRMAENIPGTALYMMHTTAATGVSAIREARASGVPIYGESLHQYLLYTNEDYKRPNGQIYHTYPSLKFREDQEALWAATDHGASRPSPPTRSAARWHQTARPADRRHHRRQCRGRAAAVADLHRDRRKARLWPRPICRPGIDQRGEDHGPVPAQRRVGGRL